LILQRREARSTLGFRERRDDNQLARSQTMSQLEIQIRKGNLHAVAAALKKTLGIPAATLETTLVRRIQATVA
jgi:hypothetical protein